MPKPSLVIPNEADLRAVRTGSLTDKGEVRGATPPKLQEWSEKDARAALRLTDRPTAWVTSDVGDPLIFAENERRKIWAVLGDLSNIEVIWNRVLLAVWCAPMAKDLGGGKSIIRTDEHRDNDHWQGSVALIVKMGPTAFVSGFDEETGEPVHYPQAPKVNDWVFFARGYGTRVKVRDYQLVLVDKETEAVKCRLQWPHAVDIT